MRKSWSRGRGTESGGSWEENSGFRRFFQALAASAFFLFPSKQTLEAAEEAAEASETTEIGSVTGHEIIEGGVEWLWQLGFREVGGGSYGFVGHFLAQSDGHEARCEFIDQNR